ncbi:MAG TPA: hypothetical protein P5228_03960 [Bacteroidales bacterium]|nr:hypothetical protein [Bacteroidales bacterium]HRZ48409.1 hypothetical protein [Bacteroidales bacterium]
MIKKLICFLFLGTGMINGIHGQDTLTIMHWNLLNYGNTTTYCTQTNNNITTKAAAMGVVCTWMAPHIITVNEVGANSFAPTHFLNNVLNINGISHYQGSALTNISGTDLANFVFFDTRKLVLHSQHQLATMARDINIIKLYHNDPNLPLHQDTAFLYVICTHLKAGNTSADASERAAMAKIIMDSAALWSGYPAILSGDMNLYTASEQAWKNFTSPADTTGEVFYDPVSMSGAWQDNQLFAVTHTQSVRSSSNGCASGGGLDDRFDFILLNKKLKKSLSFYEYIPGTYKALGNDGNHLNQSITSGSNNSVPAVILQNLYEASDHLPVVMKLKLTPSTQGIPVARPDQMKRIWITDQIIRLQFSDPVELVAVSVFDLSGRLMQSSRPSDTPSERFSLEMDKMWPQGCYLLVAEDASGTCYRGKVMIAR